MEFIGREAELQLLNEEYQKDSSFVVGYQTFYTAVLLIISPFTKSIFRIKFSFSAV